MKFPRILSLILAMLVLAACGGTAGLGGNLFASATPLPTAQLEVTRSPDPQGALQSFLEAWKAENYTAMYALLSQDSQKSISADDFAKRYHDAMNSLTLKELDYSVGATTKNPDTSRVNFQVTYKTNMVGDLQRNNSADLRLDAGQWRIVWDDGLILPELHGGNHLEMDSVNPARGNIYDHSGTTPIVTQSDAVALGVVPGNIDPKQEPLMLAILSSLTGLYPGTIASLYANAGPNWYVPVGEASPDAINHSGILGFPAVQETPYTTRLYANGVAPQAIGYVSPIQKNELDHYLRLGYSQGTLVGRIGIEKWGENYLAGKPGGTLYVVGKDGTILSKLGQRDPQPASSITLTIDENLQFQAQKAIEGFRGAIVVLERNTGRVLAMASSPGYDPNFFDPNNQNNNNGITNLLNDANTPLVDRASQGTYPLGSVFKVMTFSAALESGVYTTDSTYDCGYHFTEIPNVVMDDWTWEFCQNELAAGGECTTKPSGKLNLTQGLMRSCDPYFWSIGKALYDTGRVNTVADMARGFGLGAPTGIGEIEEAAGTIDNPASEIDAVNEAIGQGSVQVTPLQVARLMAAIGNGGTLYRPQLVEKITDASGKVTQVFKSDANAKPLPITADTLNALRTAMLAVIRNPHGTAYPRFQGTTADIVIYGKTGTAELGSGNSHAWFAGYTDENNPALPDIAMAVIAENAGEGSAVAAPIFKRMIEVYFDGRPLSQYPWETSIGMTSTPTLPVTPTLGP